MIKYSTTRTLIRELTTDDSESFAELMMDQNINRYLNPTGESLDKNSSEIVLNHVVQNYDSTTPIFLYAVVKNDALEKVIGLVSHKRINQDEVEIFGALSPSFWGSRISNEMIIGLIEYIFTTTSFKSIIIYIKQENRSAKALAEKLGFKNNGLAYNSVFDGDVHLLNLVKTEFMNGLIVSKI
ncbi:GNAT family N-acetyltransferase [Flavobacterium sp. '19STA2R22 D10 B1']|uniref:GNAT family N-acetyltransferase n=1 Tax=Flavobacterium aerium TaxID=3037261 RepID=UPI00278C1803|nr:GNAT family N-acetyltransferase [Flavobacterium sp. '19STA2R22 D10 B1']